MHNPKDGASPGDNDRQKNLDASKDLSRREFLITSTSVVAWAALPAVAIGQTAVKPETQPQPPQMRKVSFTVNGKVHDLEVDTRTTLLDALREHLHLTG